MESALLCRPLEKSFLSNLQTIIGSSQRCLDHMEVAGRSRNIKQNHRQLLHPFSSSLLTACVVIAQCFAPLPASAACPAGFRPPDCQHQCLQGSYGLGCASACPITCITPTCRPDTGHCFGCRMGFQGPRCNSRCEPGRYGQDCLHACGVNCLGRICDAFTGACPGCVPGFYGTMCDKVDHGISEGARRKGIFDVQGQLTPGNWSLITGTELGRAAEKDDDARKAINIGEAERMAFFTAVVFVCSTLPICLLGACIYFMKERIQRLSSGLVLRSRWRVARDGFFSRRMVPSLKPRKKPPDSYSVPILLHGHDFGNNHKAASQEDESNQFGTVTNAALILKSGKPSAQLALPKIERKANVVPTVLASPMIEVHQGARSRRSENGIQGDGSMWEEDIDRTVPIGYQSKKSGGFTLNATGFWRKLLNKTLRYKQGRNIEEGSDRRHHRTFIHQLSNGRSEETLETVYKSASASQESTDSSTSTSDETTTEEILMKTIGCNTENKIGDFSLHSFGEMSCGPKDTRNVHVFSGKQVTDCQSFAGSEHGTKTNAHRCENRVVSKSIPEIEDGPYNIPDDEKHSDVQTAKELIRNCKPSKDTSEDATNAPAKKYKRSGGDRDAKPDVGFFKESCEYLERKADGFPPQGITETTGSERNNAKADSFLVGGTDWPHRRPRFYNDRVLRGLCTIPSDSLKVESVGTPPEESCSSAKHVSHSNRTPLKLKMAKIFGKFFFRRPDPSFASNVEEGKLDSSFLQKLRAERNTKPNKGLGFYSKRCIEEKEPKCDYVSVKDEKAVPTTEKLLEELRAFFKGKNEETYGENSQEFKMNGEAPTVKIFSKPKETETQREETSVSFGTVSVSHKDSQDSLFHKNHDLTSPKNKLSNKIIASSKQGNSPTDSKLTAFSSKSISKSGNSLIGRKGLHTHREDCKSKLIQVVVDVIKPSNNSPDNHRIIQDSTARRHYNNLHYSSTATKDDLAATKSHIEDSCRDTQRNGSPGKNSTSNTFSNHDLVPYAGALTINEKDVQPTQTPCAGVKIMKCTESSNYKTESQADYFLKNVVQSGIRISHPSENKEQGYSEVSSFVSSQDSQSSVLSKVSLDLDTAQQKLTESNSELPKPQKKVRWKEVGGKEGPPQTSPPRHGVVYEPVTEALFTPSMLTQSNKAVTSTQIQNITAHLEGIEVTQQLQALPNASNIDGTKCQKLPGSDLDTLHWIERKNVRTSQAVGPQKYSNIEKAEQHILSDTSLVGKTHCSLYERPPFAFEQVSTSKTKEGGVSKQEKIKREETTLQIPPSHFIMERGVFALLASELENENEQMLLKQTNEQPTSDTHKANLDCAQTPLNLQSYRSPKPTQTPHEITYTKTQETTLSNESTLGSAVQCESNCIIVHKYQNSIDLNKRYADACSKHRDNQNTRWASRNNLQEAKVDNCSSTCNTLHVGASETCHTAKCNNASPSAFRSCSSTIAQSHQSTQPHTSPRLHTSSQRRPLPQPHTPPRPRSTPPHAPSQHRRPPQPHLSPQLCPSPQPSKPLEPCSQLQSCTPPQFHTPLQPHITSLPRPSQQPHPQLWSHPRTQSRSTNMDVIEVSTSGSQSTPELTPSSQRETLHDCSSLSPHHERADPAAAPTNVWRQDQRHTDFSGAIVIDSNLKRVLFRKVSLNRNRSHDLQGKCQVHAIADETGEREKVLALSITKKSYPVPTLLELSLHAHSQSATTGDSRSVFCPVDSSGAPISAEMHTPCGVTLRDTEEFRSIEETSSERYYDALEPAPSPKSVHRQKVRGLRCARSQARGEATYQRSASESTSRRSRSKSAEQRRRRSSSVFRFASNRENVPVKTKGCSSPQSGQEAVYTDSHGRGSSIALRFAPHTSHAKRKHKLHNCGEHKAEEEYRRRNSRERNRSDPVAIKPKERLRSHDEHVLQMEKKHTHCKTRVQSALPLKDIDRHNKDLKRKQTVAICFEKSKLSLSQDSFPNHVNNITSHSYQHTRKTSACKEKPCRPRVQNRDAFGNKLHDVNRHSEMAATSAMETQSTAITPKTVSHLVLGVNCQDTIEGGRHNETVVTP